MGNHKKELTEIQEDALHDLENILEDAMPAEQLEELLEQVNFSSSKYSAVYKVNSYVFYQTWRLYVDGGKTFDGKSGGIFGLAVLNGKGTLYTDDIERLYRDTRSFMYTVAPGYVALYFYDGKRNLLGNYQAVNIAPLYLGEGGGTGKWIQTTSDIF